ncbi:acyl carrier protein [Pseudophaeobacter arcticus]|jgi:acyl carrier protein|uniref:acyl carrier protein n=2 Tax=Pseudophaeobacter arcticus TaxID=385492 RepID=UPI0009FF9F0B|nr:acyl carrier protein [Pseudophaeobacter arcticus]
MSGLTLDTTVMSFLIAKIAGVTKQDAASISGEANLVDLGLQSIDAVILSGDIEDEFEIELDPATIFEHETLNSFALEISRRRDLP